MENSKHKVHEETPETFTGGSFSAPKKTAAGLPGVLAAVKHVWKEMSFRRGWKALAALNQKDGYDCPGCAWPDPDDDRARLTEYCENGAKAIAEEATSKKIGADFFSKHSVADLSLLSDFEIGKKGRIAHPLYLPPGKNHYEAISWDEAFSRIAAHLKELSSPDQAVFYTSGRTSNEAAFLYQLFVREYGTNNLPDCSNMCHESSGVALQESLGIGKGSVTLEDFYDTEVIIILGQNPGTNHPRMLSALKKAKANGAKIITVNPLPEAGLLGFRDPQEVGGILGVSKKLSDLFLQVKINGDLALLQAINHLLVKDDAAAPGTVLDHNFIQSHTDGYDAYLSHILKVNPEALADQCGIPFEKIREVATLLAKSKKIIACWAMGLTQHKNAVDSIREIVNLLLLKGSIGKTGAGTCPVRGHSNVQGDRTMGIYEKPSAEFLARLEKHYGFSPPQHHGYDTVEAIHAMHAEKAKVFFAMGGNFLSAAPDTHFTAEALRKCELTVQVSTKLNRSHLVHGKEAIILPTLGRSDIDRINGVEQFVSCENSMGVVQASKGNLKPVSKDLLSESVIVCRLAKAVLGSSSKVDWQSYSRNYDSIRDAIEACIPGFEGYKARVREPGGFYLPNKAREGQFKTLSGKAGFNIAVPQAIALQAGEYIMMSIRSHDQFNTTIYGLNDRYRGVSNERRVVFMNPEDAKQQGFNKGDVVDLLNDADGRTRIAKKFLVLPYDIPKNCVATYYPEANVLVPVNAVADKSNTPVSKSVVIRFQKHVR